MRVAYGWKPDSDWGTSPLWQANLSESQTLKNASYHYLISDHLGIPQLAINSAGEQSWKINSDAFGNSELDANNQITMYLRFPGQYSDAETGLSYNYFRDYDAKTGRYIQSDPIGLAGGINTYGYVGGNPLVYSDPTGEFAQVMVSVAVAAEFVVAACILTAACNKSLSNAQFGLYPNINSRINVPELRFLSLNEDISNGEKCEDSTVEVNDPNNSSGTGAVPPPDDRDKNNKSKNSNKYTKHSKMRKKQARTDKHRQVGDINRIKREVKLYRDGKTGNNVYVSGNRVVIEIPKGEHVTEWSNTRANMNMRIHTGKWVRKWED